MSRLPTRFALIALLLLIVPLAAEANCKRCQGAYCNPVPDLAAGNDDCKISTSRTITWGTSGVSISFTTNCDPVGDRCCNLHVSITVNSSDFEMVGSQP